MRQARALGYIVRLNVRRMVTKQDYLLASTVLPFVAVLMMGLVTGPGTRPMPVGLAGGSGRAGGPVGVRVRQALAADRAVQLRSYRGEGRLRAALERGDVIAGLVLHGEGTARPSQALVLVDPSRASAAAARLALVSAADRAGAVVGAARFGSASSGAPEADSLREADRLAAAQRAIDVQAGYPPGTVPRGQYDYGLVGTLVLFMFITAVAGGALLVDARKRGLIPRMLATEVRPATVLLAEVVSRYLMVLFQASVVVVFGTLLLHIHWGPPLLVAAVIAAYALVGAAAGMAVGALGSTFEQAILFGTVAAIGLGMLGGCMWPVQLAPPGLRRLARLTPQHWAVDGLLKLVNRSSALPGVGTAVVVLVGFAVVIMGLAATRLHRLVLSS